MFEISRVAYDRYIQIMPSISSLPEEPENTLAAPLLSRIESFFTIKNMHLQKCLAFGVHIKPAVFLFLLGLKLNLPILNLGSCTT